MYVILNNVGNGWSDFVAAYTLYTDAYDHAVGVPGFEIWEATINTTSRKLVYKHGLSTEDIRYFNTVQSDKYTRVSANQYKKAVELLIKRENITLQQLADKLGITLEILKRRMGECTT